MVDGFNRSQSDIYAEVQQFNGYDGVTEKIAAGLQARQIPDIGVFSDVSWNKFFLNDTLEPLGGYFDSNFGPQHVQRALVHRGRCPRRVLLDPVRPIDTTVLLQQRDLLVRRFAGSRPRHLG